MNINDILQETIWENRSLIFDGKPLIFKNWIKSNIPYVKDIFTVNGFLSLNKIGDELKNKADPLCEHKIIRSTFKNIRNIVYGVQAKFINIKSKRTFLIFKKYCTIENKKYMYIVFHDILLCRKFEPPKYNRIYTEMHALFPYGRSLYLKKIKFALYRYVHVYC